MGNVINISNKYDHNVYVSGPTEARRPEGQPAEQAKEVAKQDKVSLSDASKDMKLVKEAVASAPDIRSEKVDPIKQEVASGKYKVNADKVAEKLIGSHVNDFV
jgi:negative regulator of flagellin synthesis FlgM